MSTLRHRLVSNGTDHQGSLQVPFISRTKPGLHLVTCLPLSFFGTSIIFGLSRPECVSLNLGLKKKSLISLTGFPNKLIKSVEDNGTELARGNKVISIIRNTTRLNKYVIFGQYCAITIQPIVVGLFYQAGTSRQTPRGTDCAIYYIQHYICMFYLGTKEIPNKVIQF